MQNLFAVTSGEERSHLSTKANVSLMEFSFDAALENKFEAMSLPGLLIYIKKEQLEISQQATDFLLLFWNEMFV
jgi:hypothetical protein